MVFHKYLQQQQAVVEQLLAQQLSLAERPGSRLYEAMRYATLNGGKRLRPLLVYAAGEVVDAKRTELDLAACAVELIHTYSLIHDDLPAMDDDSLRRGRPTCHITFDEATAILAGDALQSLAFEVLSQGLDALNANQMGNRLEMIAILARASGTQGMAGGQDLDLQAVGQTVDISYLTTMHSLKTGALIEASVILGVLAAEDCPQATLQQLQQYARYAGLAFQIQDDILDIEGQTAITGKEQGKDQKRAKPSYPTVMSLAEAKKQMLKLRDHALDSLAPLGAKAIRLQELVEFIIKREH